MTEAQIMEKLRQVVSEDDPKLLQVGQGCVVSFLDYRYLWEGGFIIFFRRPDSLAFRYPSVLPQWVNFLLFPSASGHIYVAKTLSTGKKVAIEEMDLSHHERSLS